MQAGTFSTPPGQRRECFGAANRYRSLEAKCDHACADGRKAEDALRCSSTKYFARMENYNRALRIDVVGFNCLTVHNWMCFGDTDRFIS